MDIRELLQRVYARDREALFSNMHADFICHTPGNSPIAGKFHGPEGMRRHVAQMQTLSGHTFRPQALGSFAVEGEWAMVPVQLAAECAALKLNMRAFGIWRLNEGLLIEHWESPTDMAAFDAFWTHAHMLSTNPPSGDER